MYTLRTIPDMVLLACGDCDPTNKLIHEPVYHGGERYVPLDKQ